MHHSFSLPRLGPCSDEPGPAEKGTGEGGAAGIVTKTRKKGKPRPKLTLDLLKVCVLFRPNETLCQNSPIT